MCKMVAINPPWEMANMMGQSNMVEEWMTLAQACPTGTVTYVVQPEDTLYGLANRYNTSVARIAAANPGIDPDALQVGQAICVPAIPPPLPCPCGSKIYLVQPGDSFYSIAQDFNIPFDVLFAANPGLDPANLQPGQALCLPSLPACMANSIAYAIKPGDTYYRLAGFTGVPVADIIAANPGVDPDNLQAGQVICLPYRPIPTLY
jgi:peptidoglycan DL-endopeptidase LytF